MKILNFGSINIDKIYHLEEVVKLNETLNSIRLDEAIGGKGLNQSIALSKTGVSVYHAGKVGESDGKMLVDSLILNGVNVENVFYSDNATGHAIIQVNKHGENAIIVHGGANQDITIDEINNVLNNFNEEDWIVLQNEVANIGAIITKAKERKMKIVFNPSPITEELLTYPLELVDVFILNEIEGKRLTNKSNPKEIINDLMSKYDDAMIILTLGKEGSIAASKHVYVEQSSFKVNAVDPTGAGDTFTGYIIGSIAQGNSVKESMQIASAASAISVTQVGASNSIPTMKEVEDFLKTRTE